MLIICAMRHGDWVMHGTAYQLEEQTRKLKELADSTLVLNRQTNTATQSMERLFNA